MNKRIRKKLNKRFGLKTWRRYRALLVKAPFIANWVVRPDPHRPIDDVTEDHARADLERLGR